MRPSDVAILIGDSKKFRKQTGWRPQIKFEKRWKICLTIGANVFKFSIGNNEKCNKMPSDGGAGFIGSHLCDNLITKGYEVYCYR